MDRTTALARAEQWRTRREELLVALADGSVGLPEVLAARDEDDGWGAVKLLTVLEAMPGARKVATRRAMAEHGLGERLRVRDVDDEQVAIVLRTFPAGEQR